MKFVEQCAAIEDPSDGVIFDPSTISVESIRDATEYVGTRIRLQARLATVRQTVQIDFGVGDAVHPQSQIVEYPVLLTGSPIRLHAYPVEAAIAEKFHAMVDRSAKQPHEGFLRPLDLVTDPGIFRSWPE